MDLDERFMAEALREARAARGAGEVPVGAVVVRDGRVLGRGHNAPVHRRDPTAHAELLALREAGAFLGNYRLTGATLYVTIEPCAMCAGALLHARVSRLVYGASDPKAGAVVSLYQIPTDARSTHRVEVRAGVLAEACQALLRTFFAERRSEGYRSGYNGPDSKSGWGR